MDRQAEMKLVRTHLQHRDGSRKGRMVHRADCSQILRGAVKQVEPWAWADDKSREEIAAMVEALDWRQCQHCRPLQWDN
jgi:hypothetical protein